MTILVMSHFLVMNGYFCVDLNDAEFADDSLDEDNSDSIIYVRFMAWCDRSWKVF